MAKRRDIFAKLSPSSPPPRQHAIIPSIPAQAGRWPSLTQSVSGTVQVLVEDQHLLGLGMRFCIDAFPQRRGRMKCVSCPCNI